VHACFHHGVAVDESAFKLAGLQFQLSRLQAFVSRARIAQVGIACNAGCLVPVHAGRIRDGPNDLLTLFERDPLRVTLRP
jgi:hypothetical protein